MSSTEAINLLFCSYKKFKADKKVRNRLGLYLHQINVQGQLYNRIKVDRSNIETGKSPGIHSSILLDKKYNDIRTEAINAGILLKETDEKVDEIIKDGHIIKSHAYDVRANAVRFYQNLMKSEKMIRYCQVIFIIIILIIIIIFIGKIFT